MVFLIPFVLLAETPPAPQRSNHLTSTWIAQPLGLLQAGERCLLPPQLEHECAHGPECHRVLRVEADRLIAARDRFLVPPQHPERVRLVGEGSRIVGIEHEGLSKAIEGLAMAA
jgi:hypothetical protein